MKKYIFGMLLFGSVIFSGKSAELAPRTVEEKSLEEKVKALNRKMENLFDTRTNNVSGIPLCFEALCAEYFTFLPTVAQQNDFLEEQRTVGEIYEILAKIDHFAKLDSFIVNYAPNYDKECGSVYRSRAVLEQSLRQSNGLVDLIKEKTGSFSPHDFAENVKLRIYLSGDRLAQFWCWAVAFRLSLKVGEKIVYPSYSSFYSVRTVGLGVSLVGLGYLLKKATQHAEKVGKEFSEEVQKEKLLAQLNTLTLADKFIAQRMFSLRGDSGKLLWCPLPDFLRNYTMKKNQSDKRKWISQFPISFTTKALFFGAGFYVTSKIAQSRLISAPIEWLLE